MYEKQADPFYATKAWKRVRRLRMQMDHGMCCECMAEFERGERLKPMRATVVHHIKHLSDRPDLALDLDNLRSLCDLHHAREHPEKGGQGRAAAKSPAPEGIRIIKV